MSVMQGTGYLSSLGAAGLGKHRQRRRDGQSNNTRQPDRRLQPTALSAADEYDVAPTAYEGSSRAE